MIKIEYLDNLPTGIPFYRKRKKDGKNVKYIPFIEKFNKVESCIWADLENYEEYVKDVNDNFSIRLSFRNKIIDKKITYWEYIKNKKKNIRTFYSKKSEWLKKYSNSVWIWVLDKKRDKYIEIYNPSCQSPEKIRRFYEYLDNYYKEEI